MDHGKKNGRAIAAVTCLYPNQEEEAHAMQGAAAGHARRPSRRRPAGQSLGSERAPDMMQMRNHDADEGLSPIASDRLNQINFAF
jgi:hypothetical protein